MTEQDLSISIKSNPLGYDRKYSESFVITDNSVVKKEYDRVSVKINEKINLQKRKDEKISGEKSFKKKKSDDIHRIINISKAELLSQKVINKIAQRAFFKNNLSDKKSHISVMEKCFQENKKLSYCDIFKILENITEKISKQINKNDTKEENSQQIQNENTTQENELLTVQEKITLTAKIRENSEYTYDDKILALNKILESEACEDDNLKRYIKNKIKLLIKVRNSGFVIQHLPPKNKSLQRATINVEKKKEIPLQINKENSQKETKKAVELTKTIDKYRKKQNKIIEIIENNLISSDEKVNKILELELSDKKDKDNKSKNTENIVILDKRKTITKTTVNSNEYFKFGAGVSLNLGKFEMIVPSGYSVNELFYSDKFVICTNEVVEECNIENLVKSPLVIEICKNNNDVCNSVYEFFSQNINDCNRKNIKYRQTVVSGFPSVLKYKNNDNLYIISVYDLKKKCIMNINFKFNVRFSNRDNTVKRILSGMVFKR